jgi:hypothetical protein
MAAKKRAKKSVVTTARSTTKKRASTPRTKKKAPATGAKKSLGQREADGTAVDMPRPGSTWTDKNRVREVRVVGLTNQCRGGRKEQGVQLEATTFGQRNSVISLGRFLTLYVKKGA